MSKKVAIINYGMCNLDSVGRAVEECGGTAVITDQRSDIETADRIILPGVGSFADGMRHIRERNLEEPLREQALGRNVPFLGICLGMQLLASKGTEGGDTVGLGWITGEVKKLQPTNAAERIPHVGWNEVEFAASSPLFKGISPGTDFYFVHSYQFGCQNPGNRIGQTPYCGGFTSVVGKDFVFGVQFHPEKSQRYGLQVLKNFLSI